MVIVELIDQKSDILADIYADVIVTAEQFRSLVDGIGRENLGEQTLFAGLIECFKTMCEETEGSCCEDPSGFALLELTGYIKHAVAGCDHIINNHNILAFHGRTEEFVCNNGIASVYNTGVIPSLVEHTHIKTEHVGIIDSSAHSTFIRADDHHVL